MSRRPPVMPHSAGEEYYHDSARHIPESYSRGGYPSSSSAAPSISAPHSLRDRPRSRSPDRMQDIHRAQRERLDEVSPVYYAQEHAPQYYQGPAAGVGRFAEPPPQSYNAAPLGPPESASSSAKRAKKRRGSHELDAEEDLNASAAVDKDTGRTSKKARTAEGVNTNGGGRTLSCKECRRLKLKCDREFPCSSCRKRGCADICPEGALTAGRGSRFILANTEELHATIESLRERIRVLENGSSADNVPIGKLSLAAQGNQASTEGDSNDEHTGEGNIHEGLRAFCDETSARFTHLQEVQRGTVEQPPYDPKRHARTRSSSTSTTLTVNASTSRPISADGPPSTASIAGLDDTETAIVNLSMTFPFPWAVDRVMRRRIIDALPPTQEEANRVCQKALFGGAMKWMFTLDSSPTFLPNLLHHCYRNHGAQAGAEEEIRPRRLALLCILLAIGSIVETKDHAKGLILGEAYHRLARAAISETPLMEEPDVDVLHTMFLMLWYHLCLSDNKHSIGHAWHLMGFVAKLAQGLGLHKSSKRMLIPEDEEKRSVVFWEIVNLDCRMSLSLGRPPSISLAHVDIARPVMSHPGDFHAAKIRFLLDCLHPICEHLSSTTSSAMSEAEDQHRYNRVLELDSTIRAFPEPAYEKIEGYEGMTMQRAVALNSREVALLQLHRQWFIEYLSCAISSESRRPYSVESTVSSCISIITTVTQLYSSHHEREMCEKFLGFWFNTFSAGVVLGVLLARRGHQQTEEIRRANEGLDMVCTLFQRAAAGGSSSGVEFCRKSMPTLERLRQKTMVASSSGSFNAQAVFPPNRPPEQGGLKRIHQFHTAFGVSPAWSHSTSPFTTEDSTVRWPFEPEQPRFDSRDFLDIEHGALVLEETSFMAWF